MILVQILITSKIWPPVLLNLRYSFTPVLTHLDIDKRDNVAYATDAANLLQLSLPSMGFLCNLS